MGFRSFKQSKSPNLAVRFILQAAISKDDLSSAKQKLTKLKVRCAPQGDKEKLGFATSSCLLFGIRTLSVVADVAVGAYKAFGSASEARKDVHCSRRVAPRA